MFGGNEFPTYSGMNSHVTVRMTPLHGGFYLPSSHKMPPGFTLRQSCAALGRQLTSNKSQENSDFNVT